MEKINFKKGNGIWKDLFFRINPNEAFIGKNSDIKKNYMYMYSDSKYDYFKNWLTRNYIKMKYK